MYLVCDCMVVVSVTARVNLELTCSIYIQQPSNFHYMCHTGPPACTVGWYVPSVAPRVFGNRFQTCTCPNCGEPLGRTISEQRASAKKRNQAAKKQQVSSSPKRAMLDKAYGRT